MNLAIHPYTHATVLRTSGRMCKAVEPQVFMGRVSTRKRFRRSFRRKARVVTQRRVAQDLAQAKPMLRQTAPSPRGLGRRRTQGGYTWATHRLMSSACALPPRRPERASRCQANATANSSRPEQRPRSRSTTVDIGGRIACNHRLRSSQPTRRQPEASYKRSPISLQQMDPKASAKPTLKRHTDSAIISAICCAVRLWTPASFLPTSPKSGWRPTAPEQQGVAPAMQSRPPEPTYELCRKRRAAPAIRARLPATEKLELPEPFRRLSVSRSVP